MELSQSSSLLATFVCLAVSVAIVLRDLQRYVYVRFSLLGANLSLFFGATFFYRAFASPIAAQIRFASGIFLPVTCASLFSAVIGARGRKMKPFRRVSLMVGLVIAAFALTPYFTHPAVRIASVAYALTVLTVIFIVVWDKGVSSFQRVDQVRFKSMALFGALTIAACATEVLDHASNLTIVAHVLVSVYMYFLYQSVISNRMIDIAEVIAKAAVLAALTLILGTLFQILSILVGLGVGKFVFNIFIVSFVILILYDQVRTWVSQTAVRLIFRERFLLKQTIESILPKLRASIDVRSVVDLALDALCSSRKLNHASVYLTREGEFGFFLVSYRGPRPPLRVDHESHGALLGEISYKKQALLKETFDQKLEPDPQTLELPPEAERIRSNEIVMSFQDLHASGILPLLSGQQELLGLFVLGESDLSAGFSSEEIALLYQLADQISITFENSEQFDRMKERDRLAALGEMSAGIAHEIRNPLGSIKGAVQALDIENTPLHMREMLQVVVEEVERLGHVVSQFLEYARPLKPSLSRSDLNQVIRKTLTLFAEEKRAESVEILTTLAPDLPLLMLDGDQIRQVLLNLLINAVEAFELRAEEAADKPRRLEISTRLIPSVRGHDDWVELKIKDNGPGIDPQNVMRIFVPFFTTKTRGTGLGLAICERIINGHGGRIELQSRLNSGTTFTIRFQLRVGSTVL